MLKNLYQRILGTPFVYNHVRPFVVGGVDNSPAWRALEVGANDVVVDIGCGTGDALEHLSNFGRYYGFDNDPIAIEHAKRRAQGRDKVSFETKLIGPEELAALKPTRVMLCGLLHHLSDGDAAGLLGMLAKTPGLERVVSLDITYIPGRHLNNLFTRLDRGRFPRLDKGYAALAEGAGLKVTDLRHVRSHPTNGRATYVMMTSAPA